MQRRRVGVSRKAANGGGSCYEARPGVWYAQARINGKRIGKTGRSADEARLRLAETIENLDAPPVEPARSVALSDDLTLVNVMRAWLEDRSDHLKGSSWLRYSGIAETHVYPSIGSIPITELTNTDVQRCLDESECGRWTERTISKGTVINVLATIRTALSWAQRKGLIQVNVAKLVDHPKRVRREMTVLTSAEVTMLLNAARGDRYEAMYWLVSTTGMRLGELLGLQWGAIDWKKRQLRISQSAQLDHDRSQVIAAPKTEMSIRTIAISAVAMEALQRHRDEVGPTTKMALVFPHPETGGIYQPTEFYRLEWQRLLRKAGVQSIRFHDMRHTAATLLLDAGVDIFTVSRTLGHANVQITMDLYGHITDGMRRGAADAFDRIFASNA